MRLMKLGKGTLPLMALGALLIAGLMLAGCGGGGSNGSSGGSAVVMTYFPGKGAVGVCVDTPLKLTFDGTPVLGNTGTITITDSTGTVVDSIDLAAVYTMMSSKTSTKYTVANYTYSTLPTYVNIIGNNSNSPRMRVVNYYPVLIEGNTVSIYPHNNKLSYGKTYTVSISAGAFKIGSNPFAGISDWTFTTKNSPTTSNVINVAADGTGDFCTVQGAIDNIPYSNTTPYTIHIAAGIYNELLWMRYKNNITFAGSGADVTVIKYDNYDGFNPGSGGGTEPSVLTTSSSTKVSSGGRAVFLMENCKEIRFQGLTIENSHEKNGNGDQAETIYYNSGAAEYHLTAYQCRFISYQDTLCLKGNCWFYQCYIAGDVDYVWGGANVVLFEECEMRYRKSTYNEGGYGVQARCSSATDMGFVFLNCTLTKDSGATDGVYYLARTGGSSYHDNVSYLNCKIDTHINATGWYTSTLPTPATATATTGWREYNCTDINGNTLTSITWPSCSYQLSASEYASVFGNGDRSTILGYTPSL